MAVRIQDVNRIPDLMKSLKKIDNKTIEAGVLQEGKQAMIAHVHEYGVDIKVTPKMRAYLHHIGIHLRGDTTHIRIPERSFIRAGWDKNRDKILQDIEKWLDNALDFGVDGTMLLEMIGQMVEGKLKDYLVELSSPPLSDVTIRQKGSSNPLVDTGSLLDSITHRVK